MNKQNSYTELFYICKYCIFALVKKTLHLFSVQYLLVHFSYAVENMCISENRTGLGFSFVNPNFKINKQIGFQLSNRIEKKTY